MEDATVSRTTWPPLSKTSRVDQDNMKGSQEAPIDLDDDISSRYAITSDMSQIVEKSINEIESQHNKTTKHNNHNHITISNKQPHTHQT